MNRVALGLLASIAVALVSCGSGPDEELDFTPISQASVTPTTEFKILKDVSAYASVNQEEGRPLLEVIAGANTPPTLIAEDKTEGEGAVVVAGDLIEVRYLGALLDSGLEFDSSWNRGQSLFTVIGSQDVIPGWDVGIPGMREGGRRLLVVPSELAYGATGLDPFVPPNATLIFVIDLVQIVDLEPPIADVVTVGDELEYEEVKIGDGEIAKPGDIVTLMHLGFLEDGTVIDEAWTELEPYTTPIGQGRLIPGWEEGIVGMSEGGRRLLKVPSHLAYGEAGIGDYLEPDTNLVFVLDLLRIQKLHP